MSNDQILVADFEATIQPLVDEVTKLNARRGELEKLFFEVANSVVADPSKDEDDELEEFREKAFDNVGLFISPVDYEYSSVEFGNVQIWEQSTC